MEKVMPNHSLLTEDRLIRLPQVREIYPPSRSTIYADIGAGIFPKPVKLGPMISAWSEKKIRAINALAEELGKSHPDEAKIRTLIEKIDVPNPGGLVKKLGTANPNKKKNPKNANPLPLNVRGSVR